MSRPASTTTNGWSVSGTSVPGSGMAICDETASAIAAITTPIARLRGVRTARASVVISLPSGDGERHRVAAAKAERREAGGEIPILQSVQQCGQDARAARADRVPERDGTAVHVDAVPVPLEHRAVGQRLRGERLVRLDQVVVADARAFLLHEVPHRGDRCEEQLL